MSLITPQNNMYSNGTATNMAKILDQHRKSLEALAQEGLVAKSMQEKAALNQTIQNIAQQAKDIGYKEGLATKYSTMLPVDQYSYYN